MRLPRSRVSRKGFPGRPIPRGQRGAIAIYVAIFALLLITLAGLALDTAHVKFTAQQLQAAADAAALAGAGQVADDDEATQYAVTRQAAVDIAAANVASTVSVSVTPNLGNAPGGDVVVGHWDRFTRVFTPSTESPNAVQVTTRRTTGSSGGPLSLLFGALFGAAQSDVARSATAYYGSAFGPAVILVLDPDDEGALEIRGNARLEAPTGRIHVDSNHSCGIKLNGAPDVPRLRAGRTTVVGGYCVPSGSCVPLPIPNQDYEPDPLAGLPYPDPTSMTDYGSITSPGTYQPGYYPGGVDFNDGVAYLTPGVYVFGSQGIEVHGDGLLQGEEVMLFLQLGARVVTSGNAPGIDISAPSSGVYEGVAVFAHRDSWLDFDISGGGLFDVRGTMYMASGHLEMDGNVDRRIGRIIINTQLLRGDGRYVITGEGPPDNLPKSAFLVK